MNEEVSHPREGGDPDISAKCEEYLAGWKRAQADYQNLKKDVERRLSENSKYANERLLEKILPILDNFELGLQAIPDISDLPQEGREKVEQWLEGIKHIKWFWHATLKENGLTRVPTEGEFDAKIHEPVGAEEVVGKESGQIVKTVQDGWILNGKVIRPAKVIITK